MIMNEKDKDLDFLKLNLHRIVKTQNKNHPERCLFQNLEIRLTLRPNVP